MRILIVEDNRISNRLLQKILEKMGHEVLSAKDGLKAWDLLQKNDIKLVITDWMMPHMDGLSLCREIREAHFSQYIYIILLTSHDRKEDTVQGLNAGADDYIIKPFYPQELQARIRAGHRIIRLEDEHKKANAQLMQSEIMASVGQLAAGVAHEINNPTGFVSSNLKTLTGYQDDIMALIKQYRKLIPDLKDISTKENLSSSITEQADRILTLENKIDIDFIINDILDLIKDCLEGTERIKKIVLDLKDFAHPGEDKLQVTDINKGIESTLNVVWNELKYKATVTKEYEDLPNVKCYPQQLNQVFMNLFVNAAQAIKDQGEITISTRADDGHVVIRISDTGMGISKENIPKLFDPFFTTKEVGKGTGLGLNVAYNIIEKHNGTIDVESEVGKGTTFIIRLQTEPDIVE